MKKQASKWQAISLGYLSDVIVLVHQFITTALQSVCPDTDVQKVLLGIMSEGLMARYEGALKHTSFLLEIENDGLPMTMDHYFNDILQKSRSEKYIAGLKTSAFDTDQHGEVVRLKDTISSQTMSNSNYVVHEIRDILEAYYKLTIKTFVDNVCRQSTDYFLISGAQSPLKYFSPLFVSRLSPDELESIAGEASNLKSARAQLAKEIQSLTEAKKILEYSTNVIWLQILPLNCLMAKASPSQLISTQLMFDCTLRPKFIAVDHVRFIWRLRLLRRSIVFWLKPSVVCTRRGTSRGHDSDLGCFNWPFVIVSDLHLLDWIPDRSENTTLLRDWTACKIASTTVALDSRATSRPAARSSLAPEDDLRNLNSSCISVLQFVVVQGFSFMVILSMPELLIDVLYLANNRPEAPAGLD
nr:hypothetical protein CFP56_60667 [Quercus suber]